MQKINALVQSVLGKDAEQFNYVAGGHEWIGWKKYLKQTNHFREDDAMKIVESSWRAFHEKNMRLLVGPAVFQAGPGRYVHSWNASQPIQNPATFAQILALPELPVIDIAELLQVGSHNDQRLTGGSMLMSMERFEQQMSPEERRSLETPEPQNAMAANRIKLQQMFDGSARWTKVRAGLAEVFRIALFEILSADAAHLEAAFISPLTTPQAKKIGKIILGIDSDVMDVLEGEWEELGLASFDPDEAEMPDYETTMAEYIRSTSKFKLWWD